MVRVVDRKGRKGIHHVKINDSTLEFIAGRMADYLYAPLLRLLKEHLDDTTSKDIANTFAGDENLYDTLKWSLEDIEHLIKEKESE